MITRLAPLALASLLACADSTTTTGRQVLLHTAIVADAELDRAFDTETGWTVRLERAEISLGALYYFDGEPAFVLRERSLLERFAGLLGPSVAYAHPGHYVEGSARGQMLEESTSVLSTTPTELPDGAGVTGPYRSGRVVLSPGLADASVAIAQGVATRGEREVHFKLSASLTDISRSVRDGAVNGCVFDDQDVTGAGTVTLTVRPHVWFNLVNFDDVEPGTAEEPTDIGASETAHVAFALGVVQLTAYQLEFSADN